MVGPSRLIHRQLSAFIQTFSTGRASRRRESQSYVVFTDLLHCADQFSPATIQGAEERSWHAHSAGGKSGAATLQG